MGSEAGGSGTAGGSTGARGRLWLDVAAQLLLLMDHDLRIRCKMTTRSGLVRRDRLVLSRHCLETLSSGGDVCDELCNLPKPRVWLATLQRKNHARLNCVKSTEE